MILTAFAVLAAAGAFPNRRHMRSLLAAIALGGIAVFAVTRFVGLPWWSMTFLYPLAILATAAGLASVLPVAIRRPPVAATAAIIVVAMLTAETASSGYPNDMPGYVGYPDAPQAIEQLCNDGSLERPVFAPAIAVNVCRFYLLQRGLKPAWSTMTIGCG